jgi:hypothetical protein
MGTSLTAPTAAASPYNANFTNKTSPSSAVFLWAAASYAITNSGAAANWTYTGSQSSVAYALAFKGN